MTSRIIELYEEIDLDGSGIVTWDEFTKTVLDQALMFNDAEGNGSNLSNPMDNINGEVEDKIEPYNPYFQKYWREQDNSKFHYKRIEMLGTIENRGLFFNKVEDSNFFEFYDLKDHFELESSDSEDEKEEEIITTITDESINPGTINSTTSRTSSGNNSVGEKKKGKKEYNENDVIARPIAKIGIPIIPQSFCYIRSLGLLATGHSDAQLRFWSLDEGPLTRR